MDKDENIFYMVSKDANGTPSKHIVRCRFEIEEIQEDPPKEANCLKNLAVYVFGDPMLLSVYDDVVEGGYGCIRLVTKYQQIAYDFIDEYPFA